MKSLLHALKVHENDVREYYRSIHGLAGDKGIFHDDLIGAWVITKHKICQELLADPRLGRDGISLPDTTDYADLIECAQSIMSAQLLFSDTEDLPCFRKAWVSILQERSADCDISKFARQTVLEYDLGGQGNLYLMLQTYVSRVVFNVMGLNKDEQVELYRILGSYIRFLDGKAVSGEPLIAALYGLVSLYDYAGRRTPLAKPESYPRHNWLADYILTLAAGHESTAYLLSTIFTQPGIGALLSNNQVNISQLFREASRFDGPVQVIGRQAKAELKISGILINPGDRILLHIGAANRDPDVFESPEHFIPTRQDAAQPLSFGLGQGKCPGRSLSFKMTASLLDTLLAMGRWYDVMDSKAVCDHGVGGRGYARLPARTISL